MVAWTQKYSEGAYLVKVIEPEALQVLQSEQGWLMEDGIFQFDAIGEETIKLEKNTRNSPRSNSGRR
jgi:hypothetical protein